MGHPNNFWTSGFSSQVESCTHVGALLFKVDACVRLRDSATVTDQPAYWMLPSNISKVLPEVGYKIDFSSAAAKRRSLNSLIDGETQSLPAMRTRPSITKDASQHNKIHFTTNTRRGGHILQQSQQSKQQGSNTYSTTRVHCTIQRPGSAHH